MISIPRDRIEIHIERQGERRAYVEQLQEEIQRVTAAQVRRYLEAAPEAECNRCHTHATWQFSRNRHYERGLSTRWGQVSFAMPQVKCECGGSVKVQHQTVRPRQWMGSQLAGDQNQSQ